MKPLNRPIFLSILLLVIVLGAGFVVGLKSNQTSNSRESSPTQQLPNILLITLDTTRADHLGTYGYFWDTSPAIDALAAESIVFEDCYAPNPTTLPSHTSIFTATTPPEHGVLMNVGFGGERFIPSKKLITFTQYAKSIGFQTAGFVSAAPLRAGMGLEIDFDVWTEMKHETRERKAEKTVHDWLTWFLTREKKPFFSWIHLYDAHNPFRPPEDYQSLFQRDRDLLDWSAERQIPKRSYRVADGPAIPSISSEEQYAGEIRYMDDQLARVFQALRDSGEWDRTVIIITADHGEGLGQHHAPGHGGLLWREQLHVPLIIRSPYHEARRISDVAWSVNIFPTVLDLVTLPHANRFLKQATEGSELKPNSRGVILAEVGEGHRAVSTNRWKYILWNDETHSLFDRKTDPFELVDVANTAGDRADKFYVSLLRRVSALQKRGKTLGGGETEKMAADQVELLRALGYVDEDPAGAELPASATGEEREPPTATEQKRPKSPKSRGKGRPKRGR